MTAQFRRWLRAARDDVPDDLVIEVSPVAALDAEELAAIARDLELRDGLYVG